MADAMVSTGDRHPNSAPITSSLPTRGSTGSWLRCLRRSVRPARDDMTSQPTAREVRARASACAPARAKGPTCRGR
eukprot:scaffold2440_cov294-Prasinococcus_capsulatus_cf.AAC.4